MSPGGESEGLGGPCLPQDATLLERVMSSPGITMYVDVSSVQIHHGDVMTAMYCLITQRQKLQLIVEIRPIDRIVGW